MKNSKEMIQHLLNDEAFATVFAAFPELRFNLDSNEMNPDNLSRAVARLKSNKMFKAAIGAKIDPKEFKTALLYSIHIATKLLYERLDKTIDLAYESIEKEEKKS